MVLYWLVGWAYIERVSWGCFWLYLHFFTQQACIFCFCSIIAFQLLYILYISSDIISHFPTLVSTQLELPRPPWPTSGPFLMPWLCPPLAFTSCRPAPFSCRPSGRGAVLSFDFYTKEDCSLAYFFFYEGLLDTCGLNSKFGVREMTCDVTYIFGSDAVGNVVSGVLKGAVVA